MRENIINMLIKLVNATAWAFLAKVGLTAAFEIAKYTSKLPENISYSSYINQLVVLVFLIAVSTYRFILPTQPIIVQEPPEERAKQEQETPMPVIVKEPPKIEDELDTLLNKLKKR